MSLSLKSISLPSLHRAPEVDRHFLADQLAGAVARFGFDADHYRIVSGVQALQLGLVVEQLQLRRGARHVQEDDVLHTGREMRPQPREIGDGSIHPAPAAEQRSEGHPAHAAAALPQKVPAGDELQLLESGFVEQTHRFILW